MIKPPIHKIYLLLYFSIVFIQLSFSQNNAHTITSEYLKIPSVSGKEKSAGEYMKTLCEHHGLYTTVFSDSDSSYNFCASLLPLDKNLPSVLLINHLDVVPVDEKETWQHPPFAGILYQDTLYGRGAIDMKGLAVMQVFALKKIKEQIKTDSIKKNIIILFLSGEETGGLNGAAIVTKNNIIHQLHPLVVFGEGGGGLKNVIAGKENELCFLCPMPKKKVSG